MSTASLYALDRRLEVYAVSDAFPNAVARFEAERIVSYDNGDTWVDNWIRNETGQFKSSLAGAITGDSLDTVLVGQGADTSFYSGRLQEYYEFRNASWHKIGAGTFTSKPAVCLYGTSKTIWKSLGNDETSYAGVNVMVVGRGGDSRSGGHTRPMQPLPG
ncbi:MAG: hypothetical protein LC777_01205 [Actinobacteria bacterium]|nr:hypothetical protein [Actinomycetota bacterium]